MQDKSIQALATALVLTVVATLLCVTVVFGARFTGGGDCVPPASGSSATADEGRPPESRFDSEQVTNTVTIITVGTDLDVPERGWIIAVAIAIRESDLRSHPRDPHDRIGLFRYDHRWGTATQRRHPPTAARLFYTGGHTGQPGLLDLPGWSSLPLAAAAAAFTHCLTTPCPTTTTSSPPSSGLDSHQPTPSSPAPTPPAAGTAPPATGPSTREVSTPGPATATTPMNPPTPLEPAVPA